jgi:hypothetical protein
MCIRIETSPVSWLGDYPTSGYSAAFPICAANSRSNSKLQISGLPCKNLALQSRGGDGFSPSSRARSLWWIVYEAARQPTIAAPSPFAAGKTSPLLKKTFP